jgi:glycosyltransferase involved in cell wall biosynthesis
LFLSQAPGVGGGERAALPALGRTGMEVVVAAQSPVCEFAEKLGMHTVELELPRVNHLYHLARMFSGARRVNEIADRESAGLIYANGTRAMPYGVAARLLSKRPLIAHHHGLLTSGPVRSLVAALGRWADLIVAPSRTSADHFRGSSRLRIVPNGIDLEHFRPARDRRSAKQLIGLDGDLPVVGMVGRADPGKGMEPFLRVAGRLAAALPDVQILLAGGPIFPHEIDHWTEVSSRAKALLGERIVLTGFLNDPMPAFQAIDVFLHLADPEGFGMAVIEALACGVPVVAYGWGGVTEILDSRQAGVLVRSQEEWAAEEAALNLLSDEALRREAGSHGRKLCEEQYDINKCAEALRGLIVSVSGS